MLILSVLCLVAPFVSVPRARAAIRICKSNYTDSNDRARLRAAMQRVFSPGVPMEGIPDICRNRGSAGAWLSTSPHLKSDGVTEWWTVSCERKSHDWVCEAPVHRQLIWVYAEAGGIWRRLEVSFDDATALAQAQQWSVRAVQIIQDSSAPLPACGSASIAERQREWEKVQRENSLTPADTAIELSVETDENGAVHVSTITQLDLTFTDASSDPAAGARACWAQWIVVD
jgi:hypothetical protein